MGAPNAARLSRLSLQRPALGTGFFRKVNGLSSQLLLALTCRSLLTLSRYSGFPSTLSILHAFSEYAFDYVGGYIQSARLSNDLLEPACFIAVVSICCYL